MSDTSAPVPNDLYLQLGKQLKDVQENAADESGLESLRSLTAGRESVADLVNLGEEYFNRISSSAYDVICGGGAGRQYWDTLYDAGTTALIGAIATLLVAHLALVGAVASAVAAIIVHVFFDAGSKELCSRWKASLPPTNG